VAAVCSHCVEDDYLKKLIREDGEAGECDLCHKNRKKTFSADKLAEILDPIIREHFAPGPEVKHFGEDDSEWYEQEGDPLSFHVQEIIGHDLGFEDEVVEALVDNEDCDERDGDIPFFDSSQDCVSTPVSPHSFYENWNYVLEDLKHRRRFFSPAAAELFETIFKGVETRRWWNKETRSHEKVVWEFPEGSELFRARICDSPSAIKNALKEPFKHIGPPPPEKARAGRMNVEGVVVFYGSTDCETCLAETRPALGSDTAVIKLRTTKPLRVLDFRRLEDSYGSLSYFQPDFNEQAEKGAFLRRLQTLISQPVVPGRETDYLITQTMTEYLAYVHDEPFGGILFKSVQRSGGINIVIFPSADGNFPLTYVDESFALFSTRSIVYENDELYVSLIDDEIWIDRNDDR
jgi:hypothetical protein